ncbi:MAG: uroporphyrinogen decarboxylase family protein [Actinomycetota bacterium]|nr:uroporphyrinogen decarboxylase family protein [Actinomycetota bacterium]
MNLLDLVMSRSGRMVAPLAGYPGVRLSGRSVHEALHDAEAQVEAVRALEERLRPDIVFTLLDLTVEAEAMGLGVDFHPRQPPSLQDQKLPRLERFYELGPPDPEKAARMPVFLRAAEAMADGEGRITGTFVTGPFTLLAQLLGAEELLDRVRLGDGLVKPLSFATEVVGGYAAALAHRADLVMIVDPASSALREREYDGIYRPFVSGLAAIIRSSGAISMMHICGDSAHLLETLSLTGVEGVALDAKVDLVREAGRVPYNLVLMGNIDPRRVLWRGTEEDVRWEVRRLLRHTAGMRNFILSTGCDVPYDTPLANLEAMVREARAWRRRSAP